jgi:hypothetical protein
MAKEANEVIGKRLLYSIILKDNTGSTIERKQGCGVITQADEDVGVVVQLQNGSETVLPPGTDFTAAIAGAKYTLKDGSVVDNADYTVVYTVMQPKK